MKYNNIYKNNENVWGCKPNNLLYKIYAKVNIEGSFLDLGCGQGRDSLFMLKKEFNVTAVDKSKEGIKKINKYIQDNNLRQDKINIYCQDIKKYNIENNKFDIINAFNSFQFLPKNEVLSLIDKIKNNLKNKGYIIISGFTTNDSLHKEVSNEKGCFFDPQELKRIFSNFYIKFYDERIIEDKGHAGYLKPHQHHIVELIAQKNKNF